MRIPPKDKFCRLFFLLVAAIVFGSLSNIETRAIALRQDSNVYSLKEAGLQFEVPKGWKVEKLEGNTVASFEGGAGSVTFVVEDNYTDVIAGMKSTLKEKLKEVKSDEPKESTHNGMVHIEENGSGLMDGTKISWSIDVLKSTKNVTILTFAIDEVLQKHIDEYVKFVTSIKKM